MHNSAERENPQSQEVRRSEQFKEPNFSPLDIFKLIRRHGSRGLLEAIAGAPRIEPQMPQWQSSPEVPAEQWRAAGKGERHAVFGDVDVIESADNQIPSDEFQQYQDGFGIFKAMVDGAETSQERAFLSSILTFRAVMGLDAASSFLSEESKVFFRALERVGARDKFAVLTEESEGDVLFLHLQGAKRVLNEHAVKLRVTVADRTDSDVVRDVITVINRAVPEDHTTAMGILSGFTEDATDYWAHEDPARKQFPLRAVRHTSIDPLTYARLRSPLGRHLDEYRLNHLYSKPFFSLGKSAPHTVGDRVGFEGMGVAFMTKYPPSAEIQALGQKLLEIDRRLGVTEYVNQVKGINGTATID